MDLIFPNGARVFSNNPISNRLWELYARTKNMNDAKTLWYALKEIDRLERALGVVPSYLETP